MTENRSRLYIFYLTHLVSFSEGERFFSYHFFIYFNRTHVYGNLEINLTL